MNVTKNNYLIGAYSDENGQPGHLMTVEDVNATLNPNTPNVTWACVLAVPEPSPTVDQAGEGVS